MDTDSDLVEVTPAQARAMLEADLVNLHARVAAGSSLTGAQRALLAEIAGAAASPVTRAKSLTALAEVLGISRQSAHTWRREGAPKARGGVYDVIAWRRWAEANGKRLAEEHDCDDAGASATKRTAEKRRLALLNEKLEQEIADLKEQYQPRGTVREQVEAMFREAWGAFSPLPARVAPEVVGVTVAEAERRLRAAVDMALDQLHTGRVST
jgi:hypothetical protein